MVDLSRIFFVIPTLNATAVWQDFDGGLQSNLRNLDLPPSHVLIVDSSSTDGTPALAQDAGYRIHTISRSEFDHGATRQLAAELLPDAEFIVYLTHDAILNDPDSVRHLMAPFIDPKMAMAYGRQLPRKNATAREAFARLHNYPNESKIRSLESIPEMGFRSVFSSDSFAVYRRSLLMEVGGFPLRVLFGEDVIMAARLHLAGYKSAYVADATVSHSHDYPVSMEFRRYFDVGAFHAMEPWLLERFGKPGGAGLRFVRDEIAYLSKTAPGLIPASLMSTAMKFAGYRIGRMQWLPISLRAKLSMQRGFWRTYRPD